jgi:hypothetical protein
MQCGVEFNLFAVRPEKQRTIRGQIWMGQPAFENPTHIETTLINGFYVVCHETGMV